MGGVIIVLNPDDPEQHEMHDKMAVTLKKKGFTVAHVKSKSPHPDSPDGDAYLLKSEFTIIKKGGK